MKTDAEIVTRMRQLEKTRPSIYANSFVMLLLRAGTFILAIVLLAMFVLKKIDQQTAPFIIDWLSGGSLDVEDPQFLECKSQIMKEKETLMANVLSNLYLATGLLMLFINRLAIMVGRRNVFLMDFVEILDEKEKR